MLNVLVVSFCKPVIHKLKILGGGGGLEYYKLMWGTTRREKPNFELSMGKAKRGTHDF